MNSVSNHKPLTIVQVLPALNSGGVERGTLEVAQEAVRLGHHSIVISAGGHLVKPLTGAGSQHISWPIGIKSPTTLRWVPRLRRFLNEQQADILHARSRVPAWICYLAWRGMQPQSRPRFITTVHGLYSVNRFSAIMTKAEAIIAVSDTAKRYICDNYNTANNTIHVIYRGIDNNEFPHHYQPTESWLQAWYRQFPQLQHKLLITLPGRLSRRKGHEDMLHLIARLKQRDLAVHGLVVGATDDNPAYCKHLFKLRDALSLQQDVSFIGQRDDMRDIYALSALVLSLSTKPESFGRTTLEALSLGRPVLGYAIGGVGEILNKLFPSGMVTVNDIDQLSNNAESILRQPPQLAPITEFSRQMMLQQTFQLYQQMATLV